MIIEENKKQSHRNLSHHKLKKLDNTYDDKPS